MWRTKGFVCRGVLLDAVALRGGTLPIPTALDKSDPGIVTDDDVKAMIERQGIDPIDEGDCVFLYTGHGNIWHPSDWNSFDATEKTRRRAAFNAGSPGFGLSACEYLASRKIILTGGRLLANGSCRGKFRRRRSAAIRVSPENANQTRHLEYRESRPDATR